MIVQRQDAVLKRDREAFLGTVDPGNATYLVEQGHWFDDAARTVKAFSLQVRDVKVAAPDLARVSLTEAFTLTGGEQHTFDYQAVYRLRDGVWKASDYAFDELHQDQVTVRHWDRPNAARGALQDELANLAWLKQTFGWQPASDMVIKLYPERDPFLYSIKPSLPTWVGGWNEAGEAIKFRASRDVPPDPDGLLHESTHHMLSELTNDNASYWLQEGLAGWTPGARAGEFDMNRLRQRLGGALHWTLPQLEMQDLESMEGPDVGAYYAESFLVVKYLMETYGLDRFKAIAAELAKHPVHPVTAAEKTSETNQLTRAAMEKALGISFDRFAAEWYAWAKGEVGQD
ncbi:MAG: hypothetical protein ACM3ZA_01955 [Bacillota bacterium]